MRPPLYSGDFAALFGAYKEKLAMLKAEADTLWLLFLLPLAVLGELRTDIEFARPAGKPLAMDAFVPEGKGPFPAVIWVHGGGFTAGDKAPPPLSVLEPIAQMGYAWFSVNYRLSPEYVFPAATDDVESAIAYIKAHAAEYKVDGRKLMLMGASAGGHLVSFSAPSTPKEMRWRAWCLSSASTIWWTGYTRVARV